MIQSGIFKWRAWRLIISAAIVGTLCSVTNADWPSDPETPLLVGDVQQFTGPEDKFATVTTADGATWVAWADTICIGTLRLQRIDSTGQLLMPGGIEIAADLTCGASLPPLMIPASDNSVVLARGSLPDVPVYRISSTGSPLWGLGLQPRNTATFSGALPIANGDVLLAWQVGNQIHVDRISPDGQSAWPEMAVIETGNSSNMRVVGLVSDDADGTFVVWDHPGAPYTRIIKIARINSHGNEVWEPITIASAFPGSSRHTDPVAVSDGQGGAAVVWVEGAESAETPVPLHVQRIDANGALLIDGLGARVSTSSQRQFDPAVVREPESGDLLVCWREGAVGPQSLLAQRMTVGGLRKWGETGVHVSSIANSTRFAASYEFDQLHVIKGSQNAVAPAAAVTLFRIDMLGNMVGEPQLLSGPGSAGQVSIAPISAGPAAQVVVWINDGPTFDDQLDAHRINEDGTFGLPFVLGDVNRDGVVNLLDVSPFVDAITTGTFVPEADINQDQHVNLLDVAPFIPLLGG